MRCRACEFVNLEGANYCARCGVVLGAPCASCGAFNPPSHVFCTACGSRLSSGLEDRPQLDIARPAAERRQLTVMFVDLVDSAALSTRLDAEDLGRVVRQYRMACAGAAQEFGGYVVQYAGDGVVIYFGYPRAREDAAEQAVRAALKIIAVVGRLPFTDLILAARVGISTGTVVIDPIGSGSTLDQSVFGETPNLAARLQTLAAANQVVIGDSTRQIAGGAFHYRDLGLHSLKGFPDAMRVWHVLRESTAESRFDARQSAGLTPLIDRENELATLLDVWALAQRGQGQVVLLSGEPGIGKSRLVRELAERLKEQAHSRFRFYCSPRHASTPLYPIIAALLRTAEIDQDDPPDEKLGKLEALIDTCSGHVDSSVPLLAALLGIPVDARYTPREIGSPKDREELLTIIAGELQARASRLPLLLVCEDAQWMDPSTGAVLQMLVASAASSPLLLVVTFRSSFTPPWQEEGHITLLPLAGLSEEHSTNLVRQLTASTSLPETLATRIVERTAGIPLFIEEVTRNLVEEHQIASRTSPPLTVPTTLRDSLMARLDRFRTPKVVAQVAAVLGTSFDYGLLKAVTTLDDATLRSALEQLVGGQILQWHRSPSGECYEFRHALIRDVAYESVLRAQRKQYHARTAEVLETRFPEQATAEPESVAHHYSLANVPIKAALLWLQAGSNASRRSANAEAVAHLRRAVDELANASVRDCSSAERQRLELKMQIALAAPLIAVSGWAAPEVEATHTRARTLCDTVGSVRERFDVSRGLFNVFVLRGQLSEALRISEELRMMAEDGDDRALYLETYRALGLCHFLGGRFEAARDRMDQVIQLYSPAEHHAHTFIYGANPEVVAGCWRSWTDCFLGFPPPAQKRIEEVVRLAKRIDHPFSLGYALCFAASIAQTRGDANIALVYANAAIDLAIRHHHAYWKAWAMILKGWAIARLGDTAEGIQHLGQGISDYSATGAEQISSYSHTLLAEVQLAAGEFEEACATINRAIEMQQADRVTFYLAEGHRLRAAILLALGSPQDAAVAELLHAAELAQAQGARFMYLLAGRDLARLSVEPFASSAEITEADMPESLTGHSNPDIRETA